MDHEPPETYHEVMKTIFSHARNSLPENARIEIANLLQARLVDSIDLMMQAKQAHWNLKGPHFFTLHGLFDLFTQVSCGTDTNLWFVEAHEQSEI